MDKNKENNKSQQPIPEEMNEQEVFEPVEDKNVVKTKEAGSNEASSSEKTFDKTGSTKIGSEEKASEEEAATHEEKSAEQSEEKKETVEDVKQQLSDMTDRYIRLMAEFDNYKKRISREYERQVESANEKLMLELIDVREAFERALQSVKSGADSNALFEGMKLIFDKFDNVLKNNGLEPFAAIGEPFDPQIHDALMKTPREDIPDDHIAELYERGYKIKNKIVKHAKVIVSSGAAVSSDSKKELGNNDSK